MSTMKLLNEIDELKDALIGRDIENDRLAGQYKSLRQKLEEKVLLNNQLADLLGEIEQQLANSQKQIVFLCDELFAVLIQDMSRDSAIAKIEALAATEPKT